MKRIFIDIRYVIEDLLESIGDFITHVILVVKYIVQDFCELVKDTYWAIREEIKG